MSETPSETGTPEAPPDFEPITSQEALDKILGPRIARVKAQYESRYADYDDLKAKARKVQTADERIAAIETELRNERHTNLTKDVAAAKGVPAAALHGDTREELEACADELLSWRGKPDKKPATTGLKSGASNSDSRLDPMELAAAKLRAMRSGQ